MDSAIQIGVLSRGVFQAPPPYAHPLPPRGASSYLQPDPTTRHISASALAPRGARAPSWLRKNTQIED